MDRIICFSIAFNIIDEYMNIVNIIWSVAELAV